MVHYSELLNALVLEGDADTWVFDPEPGITPAQLAAALGPLLTGRAELVGALHPLAMQHFRRVEQAPRDAQRLHTVAPDPALLERTDAKLEELAAAGRRLDENWTIIGVPFLVAGEAEFGVCARARNQEQP